MRREQMLQQVGSRTEPWDLVVIGGGATGAGVALDAAARGYEVALFEADDFGKGTSSRSTKLVHGGVRYLRQGNVPLVMEALRERGILRRNAPHLVHEMPFVVPNYDWWEAPFYGIGLKVYDALAGKYGFGSSKLLGKEETVERLPTIEQEGLKGGVVYHDGQFDDARLLIHLIVTAAEQGATVVNRARVVGLMKDESDFVKGVRVRDEESGDEFEVEARGVINATGVFTDAVRTMDRPEAKPMIRPSQGIHLVLDRRFHPGDAAIMVPHTEDGRVLFAVPWHDRVLVGTTDTPVRAADPEPTPLAEEVDYVLRHAARYLEEDPGPEDVLSAFAGLRPLVAAGDDEDTSSLSRDHTLQVSPSGLVTITGGKWTTYRKMAEDTVDHAAPVAGLELRPCPTKELQIHGAHANADRFGPLAVYGTDALAIEGLAEEVEGAERRLHASLPYIEAEVRWAAREEMARSVEDVLSRRTRALLLGAKAAVEAAPRVAEILAEELDRDDAWREAQVASFTELARGYMVGGAGD